MLCYLFVCYRAAAMFVPLLANMQ